MGMEIMQKLNKYELDFASAWEFVFNNLKEVNSLSIELLKLLDFKTGHFFTLLPEDSNLKMLYDFKGGLILPQFPEQEQIIDGRKSTFSWIPDRNEDLSQMILTEMSLNSEFSCFFDDVRGRPSDNWSNCFFDVCPMFYEQDVYFVLDNNNLSLERIINCLKISRSFWHSLCVITSADLNDLERNLTQEKIQEVCLNVELVIVGAYDGEGYIFWEKNSLKEKGGFFSHTLSQG
jgi:hypothetical protein